MVEPNFSNFMINIIKHHREDDGKCFFGARKKGNEGNSKSSRAVPFALNNNIAKRFKEIISNPIIGCSALMPFTE